MQDLFYFSDQAPFFPKLIFAIHMIEHIARHFNVVAVAVINRIVLSDFSAPFSPITQNYLFELLFHKDNMNDLL